MVNFRITSQLRDAKEDLASRNFSSLSTPQTQRWQKVVELYNEDFAESSSYQSESRRQRRKQARVCLSKVAKDFGQEAAFLCAIAIPITTLGSQRGVVHSVIEAQHITDDNPPSFSALAESRFSLLQPSLGPAKSKPIYQSAVSTTSYPRKRSFPSEHPVETLPPTLRQKSADGQQVEHADSGSPVASAVERESDQDSTDDESDSEADGEKRADVCQQSSREITKDKPMSLFTSQLPANMLGNVYELSFKDLVVVAAAEDNPSILLTIPVHGETSPFITMKCTKTTSMELMSSRRRVWQANETSV